ncbi:MAG: hypothetical protein AAFQ43_07005 [Bacteroidota bacterium]
MDTLSSLSAWAAAASESAAALSPPSPITAVGVAAAVAAAGWAVAALHTRLWNRRFVVALRHHTLCAVVAAVTFAVATVLPFVGYGHAVASSIGNALDAEWEADRAAADGTVRDFEYRLAAARPALAPLLAHGREEAAEASYAALRDRVVDRPARALGTLYWGGLGVISLAQLTAFSALTWSARRELA